MVVSSSWELELPTVPYNSGRALSHISVLTVNLFWMSLRSSVYSASLQAIPQWNSFTTTVHWLRSLCRVSCELGLLVLFSFMDLIPLGSVLHFSDCCVKICAQFSIHLKQCSYFSVLLGKSSWNYVNHMRNQMFGFIRTGERLQEASFILLYES